MKILQLIQKPQLRGAEIFASQLSNHLLERGHEVMMVSLFSGDATLPFRGMHKKLERPSGKRLVDWRGWRQLAEEINSFQPDIVQANAGDTLKYAVLSKFFFRWKAPIIFRNASMVSLYVKSALIKKWNEFLFRSIESVISVSEASRNDFLSVFPQMERRVQVINIGIEMQSLIMPEGVPAPYLVHVGGFTFEKNHEQLLNIFKRITASFPSMQLWLVGDGPLRPSIEKMTTEMGLKESVRFLGFQQEVLKIIQQSTALVLPSKIEGLPGVILEAMYCKVPVVAYAVGGIGEIVRTGETGWLVKAGDEEAFITAVEEVLKSSPAALERITAKAFRLVTEKFDNKVIAQQFEEVYKKVAGFRP